MLVNVTTLTFVEFGHARADEIARGFNSWVWSKDVSDSCYSILQVVGINQQIPNYY